MLAATAVQARSPSSPGPTSALVREEVTSLSAVHLDARVLPAEKATVSAALEILDGAGLARIAARRQLPGRCTAASRRSSSLTVHSPCTTSSSAPDAALDHPVRLRLRGALLDRPLRSPGPRLGAARHGDVETSWPASSRSTTTPPSTSWPTSMRSLAAVARWQKGGSRRGPPLKAMTCASPPRRRSRPGAVEHRRRAWSHSSNQVSRPRTTSST